MDEPSSVDRNYTFGGSLVLARPGAWHTRFTVHSWKAVSTTLWMYDGVQIDGADVTDILRDVVAFRYQLIPTTYSLYVNEYWKKGWPVLRPMLWHHSSDPRMLTLDEQFLFGSHVLVAPVLSFGDRAKRVHLPSSVVGSKETPEWCEMDTGRWHTSTPEHHFIDIDAPISKTPVLVRAGGILILGNKCTSTVYDGDGLRVAHIFPGPSPNSSGATGAFTLVEDDGKTNAHVNEGIYTELEVRFKVEGEGQVEVDVKVLHNAYVVSYDVIWFVLPVGNTREMKARHGTKVETKRGEDGRVMLGVHFKL